GAALTNDPALATMQGLFSRQETIEVNRKSLCAQLGLAETATDAQITDAIGKAPADAKKKLAAALGLAETANDESLCAAAKKAGATATNLSRVFEAAGLKADAELDDATTVALCAKLKGSTVQSGGKSA